MKKFVIFIVSIFFCLLGVLIILDLAFTAVYSNAVPRSKFQYMRSLRGEKFAYVILGSSRVNSGIVPSVIKSKTNRTALNLGFQYSHLGDVYSVLQLVEKYKIVSDTVFIQVDYMFNEETGFSNNLPYEITPFFWDNQVIRDYLVDYVKVDKMIYYIPFLRYCNNETKIGIREVFANLISLKNKEVFYEGYNPLDGVELLSNNHRELPNSISTSNVFFQKIKKFGLEHNIKIVFFCAPFCRHTKNLEYIEKLRGKIPNLYDFSSSIKEDSLFVNCFHLNDKGARKFTEIFIEAVNIKKNKK